MTRCEHAKAMPGGTIMCSCHGLHRTPSKRLAVDRKIDARPRAPKPTGRAYGPRSETITARRQREGDEMAAALVAVLQRIRAHQVRQALVGSTKAHSITTKGNR